MCGIAGFVGMNYCKTTLDQMLATMTRRGPDATGAYPFEDGCLLHSRLAIIDPDGGQQPMSLHWNKEIYTIVYNGELYNTNELRKLLENLGHCFAGHSDTEVVLHAYAQWSDGCVEKFNGIFAFAVWESKRKRLFTARDRMGVKPFFYTHHIGGFIFASEIKTILAHPGITAELDTEGVAQILLLGPGRIPGSGVFKNIYELEPGCCGYYYHRKWTWKRYWKFYDREHTDNFDDTAEKVRFLVTDSIKRQMVSDVPIGTFLSGGLDSSLISAVCAKELADRGEKLNTFSVDYADNDKYFVPGKFQPDSDTNYIKIMEADLQSEHHWSVLRPEQLLDALNAATEARDLPGMADVDFSLLVFCGDIRRYVKVALSGECADEIFGGYPWYRDTDVRSADGFPWAQNTLQRAAFMLPTYSEKINAHDFVQDLYADTIRRVDVLPGTDPLERRMREMVVLNYRWFMQTLLDRKDRMSMYHGLEVRVPFCDYRIAEYMYSVPWEYKDYQGREKGLLRRAMEGILPDAVLYRKKSPYPKTYDPQYMRLVANELNRVIQNKNAPLLQIVNKSALEDLLNAEFQWPWYGQLMKVPQTIAYMLQINHWLEHYRVKLTD